MAIFVDDPNALYNYWCHMMTSGNIDELHEFAAKIGLKREWFQDHNFHPHYDLSLYNRNKAVEMGAIEVDSKQLIMACVRQ